LALALALALLAVPVVGCIGDTGEQVDETSTEPVENTTEDEPVLPDEIGGFAQADTLNTEGSGTGIWIDEQRDLVLSANGGGGLQIFDVSEPENAEKIGTLGDISARDVDLLRWNGTPYAVLADSSEGIHIVDTSTPSDPELVATADEYSSHNLAAVQGTPYVYDSTAAGAVAKADGSAVVPVLDLTTPSEPSWETFPIPGAVNGQPIQSDGCHDVWVSEDREMAYCAGGGGFYTAGGGETFIWDISQSVTDPAWVGVIDNPSIMYHHQAVPSEDGNHVYINDEFLAPNCRSMQPIESGPAVEQTTAAMWIYNVSDPENPTLESYVQNPEDTPHANCGSHFGDRIDGREVLSWGWYEGGTMLIDVEDPADPVILDEIDPEGSTWDARYHEGYVYGSSGNLQVLDIVGSEPDS
jgi:hypothetical protein